MLIGSVIQEGISQSSTSEGCGFFADFLNLWAVEALGDSSVYSARVALYVHLMLKRHLTHFALETIPFFDIG